MNLVRPVLGKGIVVDSARTLSTNTLWYYVNVRRLFNFIKNTLKDGLRWVVHEPNDQLLWDRIRLESVRPFLMDLWRRGAFGPGGADDVFTIQVDAANNPDTSIQLGVLSRNILGIDEVLALLREGPADTRRIYEHLRDSLSLSWETDAQTKYRLHWLAACHAIHRDGKVWAIGAEAKPVERAS